MGFVGFRSFGGSACLQVKVDLCSYLPVQKAPVAWNRWLAVLMWMALIFTGSQDNRSLEHSSRFIEPVIRWLLPHAGDETIKTLVFLVRKCAHVTEYAALALLVWWALRKETEEWRWRPALVTLGVIVLYAISDEVHQTFVPTRIGTPVDVLVDTSGGLIALGLLRAGTSWRQVRASARTGAMRGGQEMRT